MLSMSSINYNREFVRRADEMGITINDIDVASVWFKTHPDVVDMDGKNPSIELSVMKDYRGILEETVSDDTKAICVMYHLSYATVPEYVNNLGTLLKKHWDASDSLILLLEVAQDLNTEKNRTQGFVTFASARIALG